MTYKHERYGKNSNFSLGTNGIFYFSEKRVVKNLLPW